MTLQIESHFPATLTVTLTDVNDNPPVFTPSDTYVTTVSEAANPGAEVTRVLATDRDTTPGQIKYYIPDSGDPKQPSSYFQITNPSTGRLIWCYLLGAKICFDWKMYE